MDPAQTLHDFALNLLNDSAARSAFGLDPEHALAAAGLGDISAADVHEVVPLVLDFAQVDHLAPLAGGNLTSGFTTDGGQAGAIEGLKALTQNLGSNNGDAGLTNTLSSVSTLTSSLTNGFSQMNDLTHSLDSSLGGQQLGGLGNTVTGAISDQHLGTDLTSHLGGDVTSHLGSDVAGNLNTAIGHGADLGATVGGVGSTVGDLTNSLHLGGVDAGHNGLDVSHLAGDVTGHLSGVTSGIQHNVGDVSGHVGDIANGATHVGDIGNGSGVGAVHDVVSGVGNDIGHVGDIGHVDVGGVLSGNDIHLSGH